MKKNSLKLNEKEIVSFSVDVVIIVIVVLLVRTFFILPFQIEGQSMYDSYYDKEFIIVDRFSYKFLGEPNRGDVIVFKPHVDKKKQYFLKRIIGLPGDKIKIEKGKVYLYSKVEKKYKEVKEPYLMESNQNATYVSGDRKIVEYEIPKGSYFVMGDNRNHSTDSRECFSSCYIKGSTNYIEKEDIVGRVLIDLGYFSFSEFSFLHPNLGINTFPKGLSTNSTYKYDL